MRHSHLMISRCPECSQYLRRQFSCLQCAYAPSLDMPLAWLSCCVLLPGQVGEEVLGRCAKVEVSKESTTIVGDGSSEDAVKARVRQIKNQIAETEQVRQPVAPPFPSSMGPVLTAALVVAECFLEEQVLLVILSAEGCTSSTTLKIHKRADFGTVRDSNGDRGAEGICVYPAHRRTTRRRS